MGSKWSGMYQTAQQAISVCYRSSRMEPLKISVLAILMGMVLPMYLQLPPMVNGCYLMVELLPIKHLLRVIQPVP